MRVYNSENINNKIIKPCNIVFAWTSEPDWEMNRIIVLERLDDILDFEEVLVLEGGHCSCYDFDETSWDGTIYTKKELKMIAEADYNEGNKFWEMVKRYI